MSKRQIIVLGSLLLVFVSIWAAPVLEQAEKRSAEASLNDVEGEDEDLQELLSLVNKQTHQDDVMVHQEHVTHIENNNGQSVKVEQKEEKVVDSNSGKVLADVKQQQKTDFSSANNDDPQTVLETKVDIPSAGVHETFVQGSDQGGDENVAVEEENADDEPDLTPADMAAYLYETQQFEAFYSAMDRLVNDSKMSADDAEDYARAVAIEYERLQLQELEDRYMLERRSYPQPNPDTDFFGAAPGYDLYPQPISVPESPDASFDMLAYINSLMTPEDQFLAQRQAQNEADLIPADTIDPYQFVAALWNEAYEQGNEEAQEIVRLLYDRVSHDSNPDDMGEIREILMDTVAQSLGEDTPYAFDTPIDAPLAMPQMPVNQEEEAELSSSDDTADSSVGAETENDSAEEEEDETESNEAANEEESSSEEKQEEAKEEKEESETEEKAEEEGQEKH